MASKAIEHRLREAERELAQLRESASHWENSVRRLEGKIEALRRALATEDSSLAPVSETAQPAATPPPLPPMEEGEADSSQPMPAEPEKILPEAEIILPSEEAGRESPPRKKAGRDGLELELGRVWFVRIGIGLLLTGFVFLSTYAYQNYIVNWPAAYRIGALYAAAAVLTGAGFFLERWKESLRNYGLVVAAGGWAAIYYTTYAAHHIERLRVIDSPIVAAVLLSLAALAFFAYAAARKSSVLTVGALILAFYATAINPMGWLGAFSGLLLSAIGMWFFLRHRWLRTGVTSLLGAYLSFAYWHVFVNSSLPADPSRWFLVGYWLLFTAGILAPQAKDREARFRAAFASANNVLFFVLFTFHFPSATWMEGLSTVTFVFGAILIGVSLLLAFRKDESALLRDVFLAKGLALVTWGFALELSGYQLFITLTLESLVLAFLWRRTRSQILYVFACLVAGAAALLSIDSLIQIPVSAPPLSFLIQGMLFAGLSGLLRGSPFFDTDTKRFSISSIVTSFIAWSIPAFAYLRSGSNPMTGLWLLGVAVVVWVVYLAVRDRWPLPEFAWVGQGFGAFGILLVLAWGPEDWHLGTALVLSAIAFHLHGLSGDRFPSVALPTATRGTEYLFTALALVVLGFWLAAVTTSRDTYLLLATAVPLVSHFYGSFTKRLPLALLGQGFYLLTFFLSAIAWARGETGGASSTTTLLALVIATAHYVTIAVVPALKRREVFRETHLLVAVTLWLGWCLAFIDPWYFAIGWTGFVLALLPSVLRGKVLPGVAFTLLGIALAGTCISDLDNYLLRYLTLPAAFGLHFILSRRSGSASERKAAFSIALGCGSVFALALVFSQHVLALFHGDGLAIAWALLGLSLFGLGIGLRVRVYRLGGLVLLVMSLGHVLAVEVWKLDTMMRILSFLTLGLVLLALGFVYNRWHETLRKVL